MPETKLVQAEELFRELLREVRVRSKLTQTEVARRLGLPQSYVSKYETGERRLDFVETLFVCEVLG
ncbi:MAG TPA: helix-turn-helix transcriptional regulator, partial [Pyrinomonadaceae bacterium]|nr:helix-turn-helix transcriptional regulator [Pyrinomonadaceae bacterium]